MMNANTEPPIMPGGIPSEPPPFPTEPPTDHATPQPGGTAPFTIVVDTREQTPLMFPADVPTIRAGLHTGDYSIAGHEEQFTVERKSLSDLIHTIIHDRARFERELERMRAFDFRRVICTASMDAVRRGKYPHSRANPNSVVASIAVFEMRYNVPFVFAGSSDEAARRIVDWARYFIRERALQKHKRMLAGCPSGGSDATGHPPGIGSSRNAPPLLPKRRGAHNEAIPPVVHKGVSRCMTKTTEGVNGCMKVSTRRRKSK